MLLRLQLLLPVLWGGLLTQPWGYQLDLQESVTVQEGLCVLVPCKFFYPRINFGPRYLFWFQKGVNMNDDLLVATNKPKQKLQERAQGRFFLPRDPGPNDCSLTITDVSWRDSGMYFFRMEHYTRSYSYRNKMLSLKVTALTHRPHILIPGTLESGRPRNVTCSVPWACEQSTPPIFSWTSAALSSLGPRTRLSLEINLIPRPQDHGTSITCQVHFPAVGVTVERTVQLNVTYAPRDVAISVFQGNSTAIKILQSTSSLPIPQGEALLLRCAADSNPPAELSWFRGPPAPNATPISSTEILELPRVGTAEEEEFTCQIQHPLGSRNVSLRLSMVDFPLLPLGGRGAALQLLLLSPAGPLPELATVGLLGENHSHSHLRLSGSWTSSSRSLSRGLSSSLRLIRKAQNAHRAERHCPAASAKPESRASTIMGVIGGAGVTALLSLCFGLICRLKSPGRSLRVKTHRKKAAQPVHHLDDVVGSGSRAHQHRFWADSLSGHRGHDDASSISEEGQELHYAFLRFHKPKPQQQEGTNTEYSEIKVHK